MLCIIIYGYRFCKMQALYVNMKILIIINLDQIPISIYFSDLEHGHQPQRSISHFFRSRQNSQTLGEDARTSRTRR